MELQLSRHGCDLHCCWIVCSLCWWRCDHAYKFLNDVSIILAFMLLHMVKGTLLNWDVSELAILCLLLTYPRCCHVSPDSFANSSQTSMRLSEFLSVSDSCSRK